MHLGVAIITIHVQVVQWTCQCTLWLLSVVLILISHLICILLIDCRVLHCRYFYPIANICMFIKLCFVKVIRHAELVKLDPSLDDQAHHDILNGFVCLTKPVSETLHWIVKCCAQSSKEGSSWISYVCLIDSRLLPKFCDNRTST